MGRSIAVVVLVCGTLLLVGCGGGNPVARIDGPQGVVKVRPEPGNEFRDAQDPDYLKTGGAVRTGDDGKVELAFTDGSKIRLKPATFFEVKSGTCLGAQTEGVAVYRIQKQQQGITVETPHGITSVLGTTFLVQVSSAGTIIGVDEGLVAFTRSGGDRREVKAGQKVIFPASGPTGEAETFDLSTEEFRYLQIDGKWIKQEEPGK